MPDINKKHVMHGLKLSLFTGKLEAYFRMKGIPHDYVEMDTADMAKCAKATGIAQMPQVETPDGGWLTDTTAIIAKFEAKGEGPNLTPQTPVAKFASLMLEDLFDEWYWRPALYYRWAFDEDADLMSAQIVRTILRDMRLPAFLRRQFILLRQRKVYLKEDGVTKETAPAIEAHYHRTLAVLNEILARRPFLMGERPCEADFGMFGPFFRHFFSDPTPGLIMREEAPHVCAWVTRLWALRPADLKNVPEVTDVPGDLGFFFEMFGTDYLSYLQANADAADRGDKNVCHNAQGVDWSLPTAPYRVHCLSELSRHFQALDPDGQEQIRALIGRGADVLEEEPTPIGGPETFVGGGKPVTRLWT
ncbi:glutathione S-transferase family protein [Parvibaculaceae bacterium PLY_AMNH_Bact1]|nr:glutathione S-transferase family protein [Parvibaculaceae bacterium PLY_AMNH_Bact1]